MTTPASTSCLAALLTVLGSWGVPRVFLTHLLKSRRSMISLLPSGISSRSHCHSSLAVGVSRFYTLNVVCFFVQIVMVSPGWVDGRELKRPNPPAPFPPLAADGLPCTHIS